MSLAPWSTTKVHIEEHDNLKEKQRPGICALFDTEKNADLIRFRC